MPTVMVSGCYDMLHSWHVAFLEEAATYGDLHVYIGSDQTIRGLKNVVAYQTEQERVYMIQSLRCVHHVGISHGSGMLDFELELRQLKPDFFCVNKDGDRPEKAVLCAEVGTKYVVFDDHPGRKLGFPWRSSTLIRASKLMPYRIDLAGGWLDQPMVSTLHPGPVIVLSVQPTEEFNERSGMATSTRNKALKLWGNRLPVGDPEHLAKVLFSFDNPPGTEDVSGSQDALGIAMPGLTRADYDGNFWPEQLASITDPEVLHFVEQSIYLVPLLPRDKNFEPTRRRYLTVENAEALARAAEQCWTALLTQDVYSFAEAVEMSFRAQTRLFPDMITPEVTEAIKRYRDVALGWKLSGAGGGGYLILIADKPVEGAHTVRVRGAEA